MNIERTGRIRDFEHTHKVKQKGVTSTKTRVPLTAPIELQMGYIKAAEKTHPLKKRKIEHLKKGYLGIKAKVLFPITPRTRLG